jgi:branched-chain amino acid transport system substrate-binding protein
MRRTVSYGRSGQWWRVAIGVLAAVVLMAACGSDKKDTSSTNTTQGGSTATTATSGSGSGDVLGAANAATGTPVKIGVISDGRAPAVDNSQETPVAQATVKWINEHLGGIGGHPITLQICSNDGDPGKASDCANQLVRGDVAAVAIGPSAQLEAGWKPLHDAKIPVMLYGASAPAILNDTQSTFALGNPYTIGDFPGTVALENKKKNVSIMVIDVPQATGLYSGQLQKRFADKGLKLDINAIAPGTPDMTPQAQQIVSKNSDGVVYVVGNDAFCIAAFNGLRATGFKGTVTAVPQCVTDATKKAVPGTFLDGLQIIATNPQQDTDDASVKQYYAVLDKYGASSVDKSFGNGFSLFSTMGALAVATKDVKGDVTAASIIAAVKAMPESVMPGSGGQKFRCNGKAEPLAPSVCTHSALAGVLDSKGDVSSFKVIGTDPIPD